MMLIDQNLVTRDLPRGTRERIRITLYTEADPSAATVEISVTPDGTHDYDWRPASWVSHELNASRGCWVSIVSTVAAIDTTNLTGDQFTVHVRPTTPENAPIRAAFLLNLI